ncbi:hypothetical protein [uncultured Jatrophihabitans sp.]|uniref:hypothetical protein n=1 Tax=uncultured Jatrophihabitans sp. TaxID=1610747 RepID=UPI0035C9BFFC
MPIRKIDSGSRWHADNGDVEFVEDEFDDAAVPDDSLDDGYGPNPLTPVHNALRARPALVVVAVEVLVVLVLGNQWMVDHVVVKAADSDDQIHAGLANGLGFFSWPLSGVGSGWFVASGILRALASFAVTFLLARPALRAPDRPARVVAVAGAVVVSALVALLLARVVGYPGLADFYAQSSNFFDRRPSFAQTLFFGSVPGGAVLFVALVALLAAACVEFALRPVAAARSRRA